jgi:CheY-like chemotaxis protein
MPLERYNGRTIVVVEDYDDFRRSMAGFLRQQLGANVVEAGNGIEGLEAIKTHQPALVLTDILMPGLDGFEMLREIRALGKNGERRMPVIAMTALVSETDRKRIFDAGFRAYLPKPFTPERLIETIRCVLNDRSPPVQRATKVPH